MKTLFKMIGIAAAFTVLICLASLAYLVAITPLGR